MSAADWLIVILPLLFLLGIAVYSQKYARGVADFMAAGRVAGRYIISVGDLTAGLSVISLVAGAEQAYQMGYGVGFWNKICNLFFEWPRAWWNHYFYIVYLIVPSIAGVITTVWFMWGGLHDLRQLFVDLKNRTEDDKDNGQILDSDKIQD